MRQWIIYGSAIIVLGGAAWYFGKPGAPSTPLQVIAVAPPTPIAAKEIPAPAKLPEVIDLARAYEPVREPDEVVPGPVNPASFIAEPSSSTRIPYAMSNEDLAYRDLIRLIRQTPLGAFLPGLAPVIAERLEIMPQEVTIQNGMLDFVPRPRVIVFVPMSVPYAVGLTQPVPPNASVVDIPVEALKLMPRVVPAR